tara:strand:+ start:2140 stop:3495 length:1356 start_codon:yes stop_codon:yes gene_type:complete
MFSDFKALKRLLKPSEIRNIYHFKGIKSFTIDSRQIRKSQGFIAIKGSHFDGHDFINQAVAKGAGFIVAEKYMPLAKKIPFFLVDDSYQTLASICSYIRKKKNPKVLAITGSIGKTTTKEIIAYLLKTKYKVLKNKKTENNILGVAKTILKLRDEEVLILELGTNNKGEIESLARIARPDLGIVTFIKPVHLEGLGSIRGVLKEKLSLFSSNPKMKAILNYNDKNLAKTKIPNKIYWFGQSENGSLFLRAKKTKTNSTYLIDGKYELNLELEKKNFLSNFLAALAAAKFFNISLCSLIKRANSFNDFPKGRMEVIKRRGIFVINDAYNSNPYSCIQSLKHIKEYPFKKIVVLGDMLELGKKSAYYHESLAGELIKNKIDYCLTLGSQTVFLNRKLSKLGYKNAKHFTSLESIAKFINDKFKAKPELKKSYLLFLKGSRNIGLEKILKFIKA